MNSTEIINRSAMNNSKPTIGILIESLSGSYQSGVWPGILEVAEKNNVNVVCFTGGALKESPTDPWEFKRNVMYEIAKVAKLDGLLVSGTLCSYVSDDVIKEFLQEYSHIPTVTLLPLSDDVPSVSVDNRAGMKELISHLVKVHDYKKFAFIKGPLGNPEGEERLSLFLDYLKQHDIEFDENALLEGAFNRESGAEAVELLYKQGNGEIDYDVIVCADDDTAYGAIEALRNFEINVPDDIAVVGFDDAAESTYITPPITTIEQPFKELGVVACETLMSKMNGDDVANEIVLNARLKVRQSCGCFEPSVRKARIRKALIESVSAKQRVSADQIYNYIIERIADTVEMFSFDYPQLRDIVDAFSSDINNKESRLFLKTIDRIGREKILLGSNLVKWNRFFTIFWHYILANLDRETFSFADALLHEARIIRGDLVLRAQGYRRIQANRDYETIHEIGEVISNTLDSKELMLVIADSLPELELDTFYVAFFEDGANPLNGVKIALSVTNGEIDVVTDDMSKSFDTANLLPSEMLSQGDTHTVVSEPLYFHNEMFGVLYYLVDGSDYDTNTFEVLGTYISNALHSGFLIEKVQKQNRELERLRAKEHAYLKAIKGELELGRRIQMSFLPSSILQPHGYSINVAFKPAREVSGDFYDVFRLDEKHVALIIADVSGKDVSAALFMSLVKTLIRVYGEEAFKEGKSPLTTISTVNDYVIQNHQQPRGRCMFATIFYAILNTETGELEYVNGGHTPTLIVEDGIVVDKLTTTGPAIGLAEGLEFNIGKTTLNRGAFMFGYTDGVTEAQDVDGEFYGDDRVYEILKSVGKMSNAEEAISALQDDLADFAKNRDPFDDITMLGLLRD